MKRIAAERDVRLLNEMYGYWTRRAAAMRNVRLLNETYGRWTKCSADGQGVRLLAKIGTIAADEMYGWLLCKDVLWMN